MCASLARRPAPRRRNGKLTPGEAKEHAYEDIRRKIIRLDLAPGQDLDETTLVDGYGLSRTPIREILIRLAGEGLVRLRRNRGAYVSPLGLDELQAVFEAGDYLERAIVRLACERRHDDDVELIEASMHACEAAAADGDAHAMVAANTAFHEGFARAARNRYLLEAYRPILADHERIGQLWYTRNLERNAAANRRINTQHRKLFRALARGDGARGEAVAMEHADFCKDGIRQFLSASDAILREVVLTPRPL